MSVAVTAQETMGSDARHQGMETSFVKKEEPDKAISEHEEVSIQQFSAKETKKLLRKIDRTLLPFLALLYLLSFLDRANIGNARLAGLEKDLGMTGKWDYSVSRW